MSSYFWLRKQAFAGLLVLGCLVPAGSAAAADEKPLQSAPFLELRNLYPIHMDVIEARPDANPQVDALSDSWVYGRTTAPPSFMDRPGKTALRIHPSVNADGSSWVNIAVNGQRLNWIRLDTTLRSGRRITFPGEPFYGLFSKGRANGEIVMCLGLIPNPGSKYEPAELHTAPGLPDPEDWDRMKAIPMENGWRR